MTKNLKYLFFSFFLLIWSCDSSRVFEDDSSFGSKTWHMDVMPEFVFQINDTDPKDIIFKLRNDLNYPNQNLYITYFLVNQNGEELATELVNIPLFDEITGKPLGKGNSIYQSSTTILENYSFPQPGEYTFKVAQYMRSESLAGVHSIGLRIEEAN
ncbi:gliding motility lipoprotein GldH [Roseivirga sp.]|uniref:gliding motility lipoprotein GldH n=1 Tax=Roseivirga sp. TaxID=1964215 RepID=UPI003B52EAB5